MKKALAALIIFGMTAMGCSSPMLNDPTRYNTQKGAVIGAGLGALTGQIIGQDTTSTLIGTGVGTALGGLFGNYEDQKSQAAREYEHNTQAREYQARPTQPAVQYVAPEPQKITGPPGSWVTVPGHWVGNHWVPEHQEWEPIQP